MIISLALLLAAPSTVCTKLTEDFAQNERAYASSYAWENKLLGIDLEYERSMRPYDREVALAEARSRAVGNYVPEKPKPEKSSDARRRKLAEIDQEYMEKGDRITTLLTANKCAPPDHVTSRDTYPVE